MKYISTRGGGPVDFETVVREGLALDGGLYVPENFPRFSPADLEKMRYLSYQELAVRVMQPFVGNSLSPGELAALVQDSYARFTHPEVAPLIKLDDRLHLLELFHGPTLAFKDVALQFLGRVFGHFVHKRGGALTVLGATSGDTGSAAIEGCKGIPGMRIFILYPHERPSEVQRRQMTTVDDPNVHVLAVKGAFDDCQKLVKSGFNDPASRKQHGLTAVNSINWARLTAQVVYYFYAGLKASALQTPVNFVVPTGNFGNVYAGLIAKKMGLPVNKLVIANNHNNSLTRFVNNGTMGQGAVAPSLSPSMDIGIASNAERYLFELLSRDAKELMRAMEEMKTGKTYQLPQNARGTLNEDFMAISVSDAATKETIKKSWAKRKMLIDPHTAVGLHAAESLRDRLQGPIITLATAHAAKFPEVVKEVTGETAQLPPHLSGLLTRKEIFSVIDNDFAALQRYLAGS